MNITHLTKRNARRLRNKEIEKKMSAADRQRVREQIVNDLINKFGLWHPASRSKA